MKSEKNIPHILPNNSQKRYNIGDRLICPICKEEFRVSDDTKYIIANQYTCSWKCFLNFVKKHPVQHEKVYVERIRCRETGDLFKNLREASEKYGIKYSDAYKSFIQNIAIGGYSFFKEKVEKD